VTISAVGAESGSRAWEALSVPSRRLPGSRARAWPPSAPRSRPGRRPAGQAADDVRREFLRDVTGDLRYWYSAAESKAQLVLTVNGAYLTFLTTAALAGRDQIARATALFGPETWAALAGMALCLALAILSAVACLASRGLSTARLRRRLTDLAVQPGKAGTYPAEMTAFFHYLSALQPDQFADRIMTASPGFITRAMASDIIDFAPYIVAKHRWVNRAFIFTGLTLALFLVTGISYLIRLQLAT
jgi:hypothetical protein